MPTIPVNSDGAVLHYEDSGAPDGPDPYCTIVLIHGLIFNGGIFKRMFPYASCHNLRLVSVNLRDYTGSSAYSPSELQMLADADFEAQVSIIRDQGREIAAFLVHYIKGQGIPPIGRREGKRTGGVSLLAWSLANIVSLSFLGNASSLDQETQTFLEAYLRNVVLYDPPNFVFGTPLPEEIYVPFRDASIAPSELARRFTIWVSTYHGPVSDITTITAQAIGSREVTYGCSPDADNIPTVSRIPLTERESMLDISVFARSACLLLAFDGQVYWENFNRALFDTRGVWKDVQVRVLWCDMSVGDCIWGARVVEDSVKANRASETRTTSESGRRDIRVVKLSDANHFLHYDEPERMVGLLADLI